MASAAFRSYIFKYHARGVEIEIAGHVAQSRRKITVAEIRSFDVNLAIEARRRQGAGNFRIHLRASGGFQARHEPGE